MPARDKAADLTLRDTAAALGLSVGTVRAHVKAGRLVALQAVGKYGREYRLRPAVVAAFAAEHLGLELDVDTLGKGSQGQVGAPMAEDMKALYERLLRATEEATQYKALNAAETKHYQDTIARLQAERDAAQAELERLRSRGFWRRLFGGNN